MPKIDFLGDMTPTLSQKTFPPLVREDGWSDG